MPCPGGDRANMLLASSSLKDAPFLWPALGRAACTSLSQSRSLWAQCSLCLSSQSLFYLVSSLLVLHSPVYETNSFACMFVYEKTENPEWPHSPNISCKQIQTLIHTQRLLELHWEGAAELTSDLRHVSFK